MTDSVRSAVLAACMVSAGAGLLSLLSPGKALARQMKFLLSLLLAVSLAVPVLHMELPGDLETLLRIESEERTVELEAQLWTEMEAQTSAKLRSALLEQLAGNGIHCTELDVTLHRDAENCIHISKVTAVCDNFAAANRLLRELLGEEGEIVVTEIIS